MSNERFEADDLVETPIAPQKAADVMAGEQSPGTLSPFPERH